MDCILVCCSQRRPNNDVMFPGLWRHDRGGGEHCARPGDTMADGHPRISGYCQMYNLSQAVHPEHGRFLDLCDMIKMMGLQSIPVLS